MPAMPPAEQLMEDDDIPTGSPTGTITMPPIQEAFQEWVQAAGLQGPVYSVEYLFQAFSAGAKWQQHQGLLSAGRGAPAGDVPLEGTVETRTITAALELFKEQVLSANPEEVKSGEWLSAEEVDALIQRFKEIGRGR